MSFLATSLQGTCCIDGQICGLTQCKHLSTNDTIRAMSLAIHGPLWHEKYESNTHFNVMFEEYMIQRMTMSSLD